ncbi:MAG: DUF3137 domain-containing protein [Cyclobacteriaceae bacterium]|nr:DUF3137 domain-containing protein [Cyclobacteriaceae bacterium]
MQSKEAFNNYFEKELKGSIEVMEAGRLAINQKFSYKKYGRNLKWMAILCVILIISSAALPNYIPKQVVFFIPFTALYALFAPIYILIRRNLAFKDIKKAYKQTIIPKIISFVSPDLTYDPLKGITEKEFRASDLCESYSIFNAEDLVQGTLDNTEIKMSDIKAERSGNKNTHTVFYGLYAVVKLNQKFTSRVIIKPTNIMSVALGALGNKFLGELLTKKIHSKLSSDDNKSGNPEFDKDFDVYCESPEVTKSLLTPTFTQLILTFRKEINTPISLSFFDNEVHLAFHGINLFEADAHTSFLEKDISKQYFEYLNLVIGISQALKATH